MYDWDLKPGFTYIPSSSELFNNGVKYIRPDKKGSTKLKRRPIKLLK